jgi:SecD/SecF fusion protein
MNPGLLLAPLLAQGNEESFLRPLPFAEWFGSLSAWITVPVVLLVVFVVPFLLGWLIARAVKMPTYAWRIGLILCTMVAGVVTIGLGWPPKLGVDLKGGYIMIWQIDEAAQAEQKALAGSTAPAESEETSDRAGLIEALKRRLNPDGLKEMSIRKYGLNEIEIIVPETDPAEIQKLKDQILAQGFLEFLILAERSSDAALFEAAREQAASQTGRPATLVKEGDSIIGKWVKVGREDRPRNGIYPLRITGGWGSLLVRNADTGEILDSSRIPSGEIAPARYLEQQKIPNIEVLMKVTEQYLVTGNDLRFGGVGSTIDENGFPSVRFSFNAAGAERMSGLTSTNLQRQLAIVLDDTLLSAANIQSQISDSGRITGRFSQAEVDFIVRILKAGSLPARLKKTPVYEEPSDPTLGAENIRQGGIALAAALLLVFGFCLVYYRFAGVIAVIALFLNILLTLACMILFGATLTMPGLAGMVLTVGMSVDGNVLVFERIREELDRGASLRMAIRNGFDRAFSAIVDGNVTALLTAIILYVIGTDQLVGFAVTLTLGIIISMYTSVFMAHVLFDVAERVGMIRTLRFMQFLTKTNFDFVRYMGLCIGISCVLIGVGLVAAFVRGGGMFDIDLRGGSSVQVALIEPLSTEEMNTLLEPAFQDVTYEGSHVDYTLKPVGKEVNGKHESYRIDTIFPETDQVQKILATHLQKDGKSLLKHYEISFSPPTGEKTSAWRVGRSSMYFTAFQADAATKEGIATKEGSATKEGAATDVEKVEQEGAVRPKTGEADAKTTEEAKKGDRASALPTEETAEEPALVTTTVTFRNSSEEAEKLDHDALVTRIQNAMEALKLAPVTVVVDHPEWDGNKDTQRSEWNVSLATSPEQAEKILQQMQSTMRETPVWPSSKKIGGQIAGDFVRIAIVAIIGSLLGIIVYVWVRFQNVAWGFAAVVALVHDVLFMLAGIAVSYWLAGALGFLGVQEFKIDLTIIAAFLTLIGYSINDTIVIFDRMREIKGKLPSINRQIVNDSVNQTLSRSILTFLATFIVVVVLYIFGGPGIHGFAYAMLIGTFVGMYSTVFIAAPFLLWIVNRSAAKASMKKVA